MSLRAKTLRLAAVVAVPLALALAVLAADVLRVPGKLESGDVRFEAAPMRQRGPWRDIDLVRGWPAARLLDVEDDLAYRRTMKRFLRVAPGVEIFGPKLENLKGQVQVDLTQGSAEDSNQQRRAQFLNLHAAMSLERYSADPVQNQEILRRAVHMFRSAVEADPGNADAKLNLELALRNAKAVNLPGTDPDAGSAEGTISGQGRTGSGY
jgi:hypothetical protein